MFRFAVQEGLAERDVAADLRGALTAAKKSHYGAIVEPEPFGALLKAINGYRGNPIVAHALRFAPLVFVRPGELRTAESDEFDLDKGERRIPAEKMKMN